MSCIIDINEGRDVGNVYITGEFVQVDMNKDVIILIEVSMAEIMVKFYPKLYQKHTKMVKGGDRLV